MERRPAELGRIAAVIFLLINFGVIISESLVIGKQDDIEGTKGIIWLWYCRFQAEGLDVDPNYMFKAKPYGIWNFRYLSILATKFNCVIFSG